MRVNIVTNLSNGAGLQREYGLLTQELEVRGHQVHGVQFNNLKEGVPQADLNIFDETIVAAVFSAAPEQWVIPHPEWWFPQYNELLPQISKVLCKTQDCLRLLTPLAGEKAQYLGFLSQDLYLPKIQRERKFLHVAGNSLVKNTEVILEAWQYLTADLTIVSSMPRWAREAVGMPHVTVRARLSEPDLEVLANKCWFHLCPSKYEGFGHYLNEAMSVGALVMTCDAAPMNAFGTPPELLLKTMTESQLRLAPLYRPSAAEIREKVAFLLAMDEGVIEEWSAEARKIFLARQQEFQKNFSALVGERCSQ